MDGFAWTWETYKKTHKETWGTERNRIKLGQGAYGWVELHRDVRPGHERWVALEQDKSKIPQDTTIELKFSRLCAHPNVVKVLGWIGNDDLAPSQVVHGILFERCCESLRSRWKTSRGLVPPEATQRIMKCITRGLAHIHSRFVAHLDVTPANILLQ